jgi:hypothetical protein
MPESSSSAFDIPLFSVLAALIFWTWKALPVHIFYSTAAGFNRKS